MAIPVKTFLQSTSRQRLILNNGGDLRKFKLHGNFKGILIRTDQEELVELSETDSPLCSQDLIERPPTIPPSHRFFWNQSLKADEDEEDKWVKPKENVMAGAIFDAVKRDLATKGWKGQDEEMKESAEMKILLKSGRTMVVEHNGKRKPVTFESGRIQWDSKGTSICSAKRCWTQSKLGGQCLKHADGNSTHFLVQEEGNESPVYALLSTELHSANTSVSFADALKKNDYPGHWIAFRTYSSNIKTKPRSKWKVIKKKVTVGRQNSKEFQDTYRIALAIQFYLINSVQPDPSKHFKLIAENVFVRNTKWPVVLQLLRAWGNSLELGAVSALGNAKESPLCKIADLRKGMLESWVYLLGKNTVGEMYVGKLKVNRGPSRTPLNYVHPHHGENAKGIPIFQDEDEKETTIMECVGQTAVAICQMLEGKVEEEKAPIIVGVKKIENHCPWKAVHLENLKILVEFLSGQECKVVVSTTFSVDSIDWSVLNIHAFNK